jgi:hypothetical protein
MFFDWTFFFQILIRGGSDLVATLRPEKKGPVENHSRPDDCKYFFSGRNLEAAKIWRERYDRKKNVQSSGRLCFLASCICISFSSN